MMDVPVFSEWLRPQWAEDAMPPGVPTKTVRVPFSEDTEDKESFRRFLIEYRADIEPGRHLLPDGASYQGDITGRGYELFDIPADDQTPLTFSKLFYNLKLGYVRGYIRNLTDAMSGLQQNLIQGDQKKWAEAVHFEWPEEEIGKAPTETDYQGRPCAISAKKRLKEIANFYKSKRDKLQREINKLPQAIAQEDSLRLKEQLDMEIREQEMKYRAEFSKA